MKAQLHFLLLDGFDPDTGELALRVVLHGDGEEAERMLRLKLHLGHGGDVLLPLRRELQTHALATVPPLWDKGLKLIIRALEDDMGGPEGRHVSRYRWVRTQVLHPTDERRGTLNHAVARQAEILWEWAQRFDQAGDAVKAIDFFERLLLLAPNHLPGIIRLSALLRDHGLIEEALGMADRWLQIQPDQPDALLRRGEALLHLERFAEARVAFEAVLKVNPVHPLAHLGAAQARSLAGGDPCPHLDAAMELDAEAARSVLRETFDYRVLASLSGETVYPITELPDLLGVSPSEIQDYLQNRGLPATGTRGGIRESELNRWVTLQNRYQLLPMGLHWMAPTPRHIPELS
ncbi:MAG: Tetratricopeptide repeat protein [Acidobacteria bacterium ADurb.Bin340]|nr:MAG: Tetratricopeptide repeat protein [Acidobacteria bacterium ADurb.Bin340]HQL47933.1 tetratricopeptide repeat protein [Holophaga sp.]